MVQNKPRVAIVNVNISRKNSLLEVLDCLYTPLPVKLYTHAHFYPILEEKQVCLWFSEGLRNLCYRRRCYNDFLSLVFCLFGWVFFFFLGGGHFSLLNVSHLSIFESRFSVCHLNYLYLWSCIDGGERETDRDRQSFKLLVQTERMTHTGWQYLFRCRNTKWFTLCKERKVEQHLWAFFWFSAR